MGLRDTTESDLITKEKLDPNQYSPLLTIRASLIAQLAKNPPAVQETRVQSLSWRDSLENQKATHSSILAWRIP